MEDIVCMAEDVVGAKYVEHRLARGSKEEIQRAYEALRLDAHRLGTHVFGNHCIQKMLDVLSMAQRIQVYQSAIVGRVVELSLHTYGCRMLQKGLDTLDLTTKQAIANELKLQPNLIRFIEHQNGNHVIQKCLDTLPSQNCLFIVDACQGQVIRISLHSYGCRVMQRVLEHCPMECIESLLSELGYGYSVLISDQFGNYVVQHVLKFGRDADRTRIVTLVANNILQYSSHKYASNVVERCLDASMPLHLKTQIVNAAFDNTTGKAPILSMVRDPYANYVVQRVLSSELVDVTDPQRRDVLVKLHKHLPALRKFTYGRHIVEGIERLRRRTLVEG